MADEFPTLEVAEAVAVLWLGWRSWLLWRGAASLREDSERLAERAASAETLSAPQQPWLLPLARVAASVLAGALPAHNAAKLLSERAARVRLGLRAAAARDLVVCAILLGALIYAGSASLEVGPPFFTLGGVASALLLSAVGARLKLAAGIADAAAELARALGRRDSRAPAAERCSSCGKPGLLRFSGPLELGQKLVEHGVSELGLCAHCGRVSGRARVSNAQGGAPQASV